MTLTEKKDQIRDAIHLSNVRWDGDKIYANYLLVEQDLLEKRSKPAFYLLDNAVQQTEPSMEGYQQTRFDLSLQGHFPLTDKRGKSVDDKIVRFEKTIAELMQYLLDYRTPYPQEQRLGIIENSIVSASQASQGDLYIYEKRFLVAGD